MKAIFAGFASWALGHPTGLAILGGLLLAYGAYLIGVWRGRDDRTASDRAAMSGFYRSGFADGIDSEAERNRATATPGNGWHDLGFVADDGIVYQPLAPDWSVKGAPRAALGEMDVDSVTSADGYTTFEGRQGDEVVRVMIPSDTRGHLAVGFGPPK